MNAYQEDPQQALLALEKIAGEIPSGVSAEDVDRMLGSLGFSSEEIMTNLNTVIVDELKTDLNHFWQQFQLTEKLAMIKELQLSDHPIKPPTTPTEIRDTVDAMFLRLQKKKLLSVLDKLKAENKKLEDCLNEKVEPLKKQLDIIKKL